jgi:HEAT repeat protein
VAFELPTNVAILAAAIAASLTVVLLFYSLGLRVARILHNRDLERLRIRWWPIIARATMTDELGKESELFALRRGSRTKLLREWCRFRTLVRGSSSMSLGLLAEELGLLRVARRLLQRRSVSNKLLALQALGFLHDLDSWNEIETLLDHRNITISITAATALAHINAKQAIGLIMPMIGKRPSWPRTQVGRILNLAGPDAVTGPLCRAIKAADPDEACRLLQFYESASMSDIDSLVAKLLISRTEPALIAAALKTVRGQLPNTTIAKLAKHKVWFVRMQAASLLGRFGRREDYQILEPLLSDTEWWVRYRAAQAISKLPFLGPNALRKLRDRQKDPYARDILRQALAEAGMA